MRPPGTARAERSSDDSQLLEWSGGGRGIRTPKGLAARWISSPLPCQLRLALRLPHTLSQYHYLTNGLARYLLGLVSIIVRGDGLFVRVSLQRALGLSQCGQKVLSLHDSVTAEDRGRSMPADPHRCLLRHTCTNHVRHC